MIELLQRAAGRDTCEPSGRKKDKGVVFWVTVTFSERASRRNKVTHQRPSVLFATMTLKKVPSLCFLCSRSPAAALQARPS